MAFHSFPFLFLFLPLTVAIYRVTSALGSARVANGFLLAASVVFYAQSGIPALGVVALSLLLNHVTALGIAGPDPAQSRRWLMAGIAANVALLAWLKYPGLFGQFPWLRGHLGFPLGVSFFTIQRIVGLMDIREGLAAPVSLADDALTILYFPCISAGPITRPRDMVREFHAGPKGDWAEDISRGLIRFAIGLFKKAAIADNLAIVVAAGYAATNGIGLMEALIVCVGFTLQIYFDFSGYCDMAIGAARMLGHTVPENFNRPLSSKSISEFWQRWHITLSTFITSYMYTPILRALARQEPGRKRGRVTQGKAIVATIAAMAIAGVWHGSGLVFLIFGLLHGVALAVNMVWKRRKLHLPDAIGLTLTFAFITLSFVFFRAPDVGTAMAMLGSLTGAHGLTTHASLSYNTVVAALRSNWGIPACAGVLALAALFFRRAEGDVVWLRPLTARLAFGVAALSVVAMLFMNSIPGKGFIYAIF